MKTAIIYHSSHHGNTKKLVDAIAKAHDVTLINATEDLTADLSGYGMVGFASGIYYGKFHKSVLKAAEKLPKEKKVFFLYTYGAKKEGYTNAISQAVKKSGARIMGEYGCFGFDSFGPFKLVGGIAKGHPTPDEINDAVCFFDSLLEGAV